MKCEKEDNVTLALEICQSLLKDPNNMPHVNVINRDTPLMNFITTFSYYIYFIVPVSHNKKI